MKKLITVLAASALISMPSYAGLIIDNFVDGSTLEVDGQGIDTSIFTPGNSVILGGQRDTYLETMTTSANGANVKYNNALSINSESLVNSKVTLTWDGSGGVADNGSEIDPMMGNSGTVNVNGLKGLDPSNGNDATKGFDFFAYGDSLAFDVLANEAMGFTFTINIWSDGVLQSPSYSQVSAGNTGLVLFPLLFINPNEDVWKNITAFQIFVEGMAEGFDLTVNEISIVQAPEPASLSIFGLSLLGLGALQRKRKLTCSA